MAQIILIRPGCTEFDEQHRIQGNLNLPLSSVGRRQVEKLLSELAHVDIDLLYTSPCEAARSTALAIAEARGLDVREIDELHNVNHGFWQGLKIDDVRRKHPKLYRQWQDSPDAICPPGGELLSEAISRVRKALEKPLRKKGNLGIVAADPLATIIEAVVRESSLDTIPAVCNGHCGSWIYLRGNLAKTPTAEFPAVDFVKGAEIQPATIKN